MLIKISAFNKIEKIYIFILQWETNLFCQTKYSAHNVSRVIIFVLYLIAFFFVYQMFYKVDVEVLRRLSKRFKKLDLDGSGSLSVEEFRSIPELKQNPLVERVIALFDKDGNGVINFTEFIEGISQFTVNGNKEDKLNFVFKIYDLDQDGFISNKELFSVLKLMVGANLLDQQLQQIVDKTIRYNDKDFDGKISFQEFKEVSWILE